MDNFCLGVPFTNMSIRKTYKEGRFSQINLSDGNKVLISRGSDNTKVFRIGFLSLPKGMIHVFSDLYTAHLINNIGITNDTVNYLASELVKVDTLAGVKAKCLQLELDMAKKKGYEVDVPDDSFDGLIQK